MFMQNPLSWSCHTATLLSPCMINICIFPLRVFRFAWQMSFMPCVFFTSLCRSQLSFHSVRGKSVKTDKIAYFSMKGVGPFGWKNEGKMGLQVGRPRHLFQASRGAHSHATQLGPPEEAAEDETHTQMDLHTWSGNARSWHGNHGNANRKCYAPDLLRSFSHFSCQRRR